MRDYRRIQAWSRGQALAADIDRAAMGFARKGYAHLRAQLVRAADSIPSNIVEGCAAATNRELARFLEIAVKSANETEYHLLTVRSRKLLPPDRCERLIEETIEVRKMTYVYRRKVLEAPESG